MHFTALLSASGNVIEMGRLDLSHHPLGVVLGAAVRLVKAEVYFASPIALATTFILFEFKIENKKNE